MILSNSSGGDYHASDLSFWWDNQWPPIFHAFNENDKIISKQMTTFLTNMAKTGIYLRTSAENSLS